MIDFKKIKSNGSETKKNINLLSLKGYKVSNVFLNDYEFYLKAQSELEVIQSQQSKINKEFYSNRCQLDENKESENCKKLKTQETKLNNDKDKKEKNKKEALLRINKNFKDNLDYKFVEEENKEIFFLYEVPNFPLEEDMIIGASEVDNKELEKSELKPTKTESTHHLDILVSNDYIDVKNAVKMSGSRFAMYKGTGSKIVRNIEKHMLEKHIRNNFVEIRPPLLTLRESLFNSGQLPKFKDDLYPIYHDNDLLNRDKELSEKDMFLIPTAEVPLLNIHSNEIVENLLNESKRYTAYTPCFRQEAGAAGKDTKGVIRTHQFNKVELVSICSQNNWKKEFDLIVNSAKGILEDFKLPYRVIQLCTGDLGFTSALTYDIEVWMPSRNAYVEISSVSLCTDFQARRAKIRYKDDNNKKNTLAYTLNGSGLAIDRLFAALVENYYNEQTKQLELPYEVKKILDL